MLQTQKEFNDLTYRIIGAAIEVQTEMGAGLLEHIYERCLSNVLRKYGLRIQRQQKIPVKFQGEYLDCDLRYDILVEESIIIEVKACENFLPIHEAQLITYLKLLKKPKGILLNFNTCNIFRDGQKTIVMQDFMKLPKGY